MRRRLRRTRIRVMLWRERMKMKFLGRIMRRREASLLLRIEGKLAEAEPRLAAMWEIFERLNKKENMPQRERIWS